ncbi:RNA polymerase sigma-54 factor, partial [Alcaligenes nematophilus]|nr:hypothetical protein [Bacillus cereus]MDY7129906.1 RNA polymerase sigma-54 factor [Alcaligenes nematophilus]
MKLEMVPQLHMQQTLSQRLQQSAQILQLSAQELQTLVQDSLQDNPLLEPAPEPAAPVREGLSHPVSSQSAHLIDKHDISPAPRSRDEQILEHVRLSHASERCKALCALIVNALDDNGYLRDHFEDLLPAGYEHIPLAEWQTALALVQSLSVPGTGAHCLSDALRLQIQARQSLDPVLKQRLLKLVATELPALAQGEWSQVQSRLNLSDADFHQALR